MAARARQATMTREHERENDRAAIGAAIESAGISEAIAGVSDLSGGCIHRVVKVSFAQREPLVAKINNASARASFEEEAQSLRALAATQTVVTPEVLAIVTCGNRAATLMTFINLPNVMKADAARDNARMWRNFGRDLAALHTAALPADCRGGYGFAIDNHLGSTPQPNGWRKNWVEFNSEHRLGNQIRLAISRDLLSASEAKQVEAVIARLGRLLPLAPPPSLLHGDLWSGNALPACRGNEPTCAVIDPACSIGDALADLAMMRLFGGFPDACFQAWRESTGVNPQSDDSATAIAVYQLYHVLNHINIFGRGYVGQALDLVRRLT
jgi:fructosamine-3-kinase